MPIERIVVPESMEKYVREYLLAPEEGECHREDLLRVLGDIPMSASVSHEYHSKTLSDRFGYSEEQ